MAQIDYKRRKELLSLGRNGYVWTDGLYIDKASVGHKIDISPINSRGEISSCSVAIPMEHVQDLINELEKLK